jgi:hypothetical protein
MATEGREHGLSALMAGPHDRAQPLNEATPLGVLGTETDLPPQHSWSNGTLCRATQRVPVGFTPSTRLKVHRGSQWRRRLVCSTSAPRASGCV